VSRYRFIAAEKAQHSVVLLCRVLDVARSAFYAWQHQQPSARAQADEQLADEIKDIYDDSRCTYGSPRVHAELSNRGKRVGRKRVARLMRKAGFVGRTPRRFRRTTTPDPTTQVQDLVQRQFRPTEPNQLWLSDITYIRTWEGWLYLAVILDGFSRRVVGWALADHLRTELATAALHMALTSRRPPPGLIHHSDRGSQAGFKESSQHCRQELRCHNTNVAAQIGHCEPVCGRRVVRQLPVESIGNASGRQSPRG
jgi:transposase InsO family protein